MINLRNYKGSTAIEYYEDIVDRYIRNLNNMPTFNGISSKEHIKKSRIQIIQDMNNKFLKKSTKKRTKKKKMAKVYKFNKDGEKIEIKDTILNFYECKAISYDGEDNIFKEHKCKKCKDRLTCNINKKEDKKL